MLKTNMLSDNKVLRQLWGGPLLELVVRLNGKRGPETVEMINKLLRDELMPIPISKDYSGVEIIKTVLIKIGGGRTTDDIIKSAKELDGDNRPSYINDDIIQANTPSGYGPERTVLLEFGKFDHSPTIKEVWTWITQPGYGFPTYEDGLRFQEDHPEDQRGYPHIFVPEIPWCGAADSLEELSLWGWADRRELVLGYYRPGYGWSQHCVFARRKYVLGPSGK